MNTPTCKTCKHFTQHYTLDEQTCMPVDCGHCCYPRLKKRVPDTPACANYELCEKAKLPDRDGVIHYLATKLLDHILSLELPPELEKGG